MSEQLSDYDFDLPQDLIALRPVKPRSAARLLVAEGDQITDAVVQNLTDYLRPDDLLVFNNTRVIPARLRGTRTRATDHGSGVATIEVTLININADTTWHALCKPAKRLQPNDTIVFSDGFQATVLGKDEGQVQLEFNLEGVELDQALEAQGDMPLPPYIAGKRTADLQDRDDYQTYFAEVNGAVAAPTASLHFDAPLLAALKAHGVHHTFVTLHVGAGTFLPVKSDDISKHRMHSEWGQVTQAAAEAIMATRARGGRVIPVGTTALRLIETAATGPGTIGSWTGDTDIFIRPGYEFLITDALMTNFHLPKSTLMMLVSALMGREVVRSIYAHAINQQYRFFSYGDASLLVPKSENDAEAS